MWLSIQWHEPNSNLGRPRNLQVASDELWTERWKQFEKWMGRWHFLFTWINRSRNVCTLLNPSLNCIVKNIHKDQIGRISIDLNFNTKNLSLSFSQLVSGRNSTNPAIWLVTEAGGIFLYGPPKRAESVELIYFRKPICGNRQSFALFTLPQAINQHRFTLCLPLYGKESNCKLNQLGF